MEPNFTHGYNSLICGRTTIFKWGYAFGINHWQFGVIRHTQSILCFCWETWIAHERSKKQTVIRLLIQVQVWAGCCWKSLPPQGSSIIHEQKEKKRWFSEYFWTVIHFTWFSAASFALEKSSAESAFAMANKLSFYLSRVVSQFRAGIHLLQVWSLSAA